MNGDVDLRLKELRESRSLSQRELGDELGLSKSSIGNYEDIDSQIWKR